MTSSFKSKINVLAVADLHGRYDKIEIPDDADIVVLAGDIVAQKDPNRNDICSCADQIEDICKDRPDVQILFVLGNHDYAIKDKLGLDEELESRLISNLHCFGKKPKVVDVCGLRIGGFGWDAGHREDRYLSRYEQNESDFSGVDMLVMHCPPRISGAHLHEDNLGLSMIVKEVSPNVAICGHAHGQAGVYDLDGIPVYCVAGKATMLSVDL